MDVSTTEQAIQDAKVILRVLISHVEAQRDHLRRLLDDLDEEG